jgi:hypothetical protein
MDRGRFVYHVGENIKTVNLINIRNVGRVVDGLTMPFEFYVSNHNSLTAASTVYFGKKTATS